MIPYDQGDQFHIDPLKVAWDSSRKAGLQDRPESASRPQHPANGSKPEKCSVILVRLLREFDARSVRFLLWKSPSTRSRALEGKGDTDLLVAEGDHGHATDVLKNSGFQQIQSAAWRHQPFVSDWYAADPLLGRVIHVQLYEKLVLGSAFDPQIEVPEAGRLFEVAPRRFPPEPSPSDAAVLQVCRAALAPFYRPGLRKRLLAEARKLVRNVSPGELEASAALYPPETAAIISRTISGDPLRTLRKQLRKAHRSPQRAGGDHLLSRLLAGAARWNRRKLRFPVLCRRRLPRPSPVIAVIGSDGSGKSTVSRSLTDLLAEKIDTRFIYFGTGDGPSSWYRKPLIALQKLTGFGQKSQLPGATAANGHQRPNLISDVARALWAITVAFERRKKMRQARRASAAGWIVITDRFPQVEVPGTHDGPRLNAWLGKGGLRGRLARWEQRVYRKLTSIPPDLVLFLDVSLDTAQKRRPGESVEELHRRIEVAESLRFGQPRRVTIDAGLPVEKVIGSGLENIFCLLGDGS